MDLSIVIPCFNEEDGLVQLHSKLIPVVKKLNAKYSVEVIFVDDGSTDGTNALLHKYFGKLNNCTIIKHGKNKNLGAALKTGIANSRGNLVAFLDSDCTYDPNIIFDLLGALDNETDIVTASPYHPKGHVVNAPFYRIFLSKSVTLLYQFVLFSRMNTFTAIARVYRRKVLNDVKIKSNTFIGVTELLVFSLLKGFKVKEIPATLRGRKFGTSKVKVIGVIFEHIKLLFNIILIRLFGASFYG